MRRSGLGALAIIAIGCNDTGLLIEVVADPSIQQEIPRLEFIVARQLATAPGQPITFADLEPGAQIDLGSIDLRVEPYRLFVRPAGAEQMDDSVAIAAFGLDADGNVIASAGLDRPMRFVSGKVLKHRLTLIAGGFVPGDCEPTTVGGRVIQIGRPPDADCDGWLDGEDCDDLEPNRHPDNHEDCIDGVDNDCDLAVDETSDVDGDGFFNCEGDCNDVNADVNPQGAELCDGLDNDCNGQCDVEFDTDDDHYTVCGTVIADTHEFCFGGPNEPTIDCQPEVAEVFPGAIEQCNGADDNCDWVCDEDPALDPDGDRFTACGSVKTLCGTVPQDQDCEPDDGEIHPGAAEVCNGKDDNCDGLRLDFDFCLDPVGECVFGSRSCSEEEQIWGPCVALEETPLPPEACIEFARCEADAPPDPLDCLMDRLPTTLNCTLHYAHGVDLDGQRPLCPPTAVALPVKTGPTCEWILLGGGTQQSYSAGLATAVGSVEVQPTIIDCSAALVILEAKTNPPREDRFLLALRGLDSVEVLGVEIEPEPVDGCSDVGLECDLVSNP